MIRFIEKCIEEFNLAEYGMDILKGIIIAVITAGVAKLFTDRYLKKYKFVKRLVKHGFECFASDKNISEREYKKIFSNVDTIKLLFVTGIGFFTKESHQRMIKEALKRGAKIQILLARKNNQFLKDIYQLECNNFNRSFDDDLNLEVETVHNILESINKESDNKIEVRYYSTEYRLPLVIASFKKKNKEITKAWLNITLPPEKASKHLLLEMKYESDDLQDKDENFIGIVVAHFDSIWKLSKTYDDSTEQYWNRKYEEALHSTLKTNKCLILVSAQHPLINGVEPNDEFKNRLDAAIELHNKLKSEGKEVKIYVPGSVHKANGIVDDISLSEAGKRYLLKHSINEEDIYADEMNIKYKKDKGVYNSADECYVAAKIFKDEHFEKLYCFCSPFQVSKNQLFLLENGVLGNIYSIPSNNYFHNPYFEFSEIIPDVLFYDHSWQDNSFYGNKSRNERKP